MRLVKFSFFIFFLIFCPRAQAARVSPEVIFEQASPGDILEYEVTVSKGDSGKRIYPVVVVEGFDSKQGEMVENEDIDDWIRIPRGGFRLKDGEEKTLELQFDIRRDAEPGDYYAKIFFAGASNRAQATNIARRGDAAAELLVHIQLAEKTFQHLQVNNLKAGSKVFFGLPIKFDLELENAGNESVSPVGDMGIYSSNGQEIKSIDVSDSLEEVEGGDKRSLSVLVDDFDRFGKFKAKLRINYDNNTKYASDIVYFIYFPWQKLLIFGIGAFLIILLLSIITFRKFNKR
jgi:hypothetical protein